jgi:hypothetical protein
MRRQQGQRIGAIGIGERPSMHLLTIGDFVHASLRGSESVNLGITQLISSATFGWDIVPGESKIVQVCTHKHIRRLSTRGVEDRRRRCRRDGGRARRAPAGGHDRHSVRGSAEARDALACELEVELRGCAYPDGDLELSCVVEGGGREKSAEA